MRQARASGDGRVIGFDDAQGTPNRLSVNAGGFSLFTGRPSPTSPDFGGGLYALDTFGTEDGDAQIRVRFACESVEDGCAFDDTLAVTGWVP